MRLWAFTLVIAVSGATLPGRTAPAMVIHVDDDASPGGNGTGRFPFDNLPDAVATPPTVPSQAVIIIVEPGDYPLAQHAL